MVKIGERLFPIKVKSDGSFNENLSHLYCEGINEIKVFAYDKSTGEASNIESVKVDEIKTLTLNVCNLGCPITASFEMDCVTKNLSVTIENGSGTYTYDWSKGNATTNSVVITQADSFAGTICVIVNDVTNNCSKTFCTKYSTRIDAFIEGRCGPNLTAIVYGGVEPISYNWSNGNNAMTIPNSGAGSYTVTVTDAQGCSSIAITQAATLLTLNPKPSTCSKEFYSFESTGLTKAIIFSSGLILTYTDVSNLNKFETGFDYKMLVSNKDCEESIGIKLPQILGLSADVSNTTCGTCSDGFIVPVTSNECFECTFGSIKILGENKIKDFTAENTAKTLAKGIYYVVVEDAITACYIGIKKVEIK
jgi:hypothetical protein